MPGASLKAQLWERFECKTSASTFLAVLLDPSFALGFVPLFGGAGTTRDIAHTVLERHLTTISEAAQSSQLDTAATQHSSSSITSDDSPPAAKRQRSRLSLPHRLYTSKSHDTNDNLQKMDVLKERDRYLDHVRLHDLSKYYDHGAFDTLFF